MISKENILHAIKEGNKNRILKEDQDKINLENEKKKQLELMKKQDKLDNEKADKILSQLPNNIKLSITENKSSVEICRVSDAVLLEQNCYRIIINKLKELNLNPFTKLVTYEDWNSYDTGYPEHCSYVFIGIPTPKNKSI